MRLWTVQPPQVLDALERDGQVFVDERRFQGEIPPAYEWLRRNAGRVLPDYGGRLFWWFYCRKPRVSRQRRLFARGVRQAIIEVELPASRAFSMQSWAWGVVYLSDYLALTRAEYARWVRELRAAVPDENEWPLPEPFRSRLERSWDRLFDPDLPQRAWRPARTFDLLPYFRGREAVAECISAGDVRGVTLFEGTAIGPFAAIPGSVFSGESDGARRHAGSA